MPRCVRQRYITLGGSGHERFGAVLLIECDGKRFVDVVSADFLNIVIVNKVDR